MGQAQGGWALGGGELFWKGGGWGLLKAPREPRGLGFTAERECLSGAESGCNHNEEKYLMPPVG